MGMRRVWGKVRIDAQRPHFQVWVLLRLVGACFEEVDWLLSFQYRGKALLFGYAILIRCLEGPLRAAMNRLITQTVECSAGNYVVVSMRSAVAH